MSNIIIIGPLPPPVGGIASIISNLKSKLDGKENVRFLNTAKCSNRFMLYLLPVRIVIKIFWCCFVFKRSRVLIFSSANRSFYEKCFWAFLIYALGSKPYIVMVDGNFPHFFSKLHVAAKSMFRYLMKKVVIGAQSQSWKNYYQSIFPNSKIGIIDGCVDTDFFVPTLKQDNNAINVLYVGWVIAEKGIFDLLEGMRELKKSHENFCLEIVGPVFMPVDQLQNILVQNGLKDCVKIIGPLHGREALRKKYQQADIFVFPSHFEGFPVALLEAVSSGLPCIGTNVGGIPDILNECGIIVEKESPYELSRAISSLLEDPRRRLVLGNKSREKALSYYTLEKSVDSYMALLSIERET